MSTPLPVVVGGLGATIPARRVTNHELAEHLDTSHEWILDRTGIAERRVVSPHQATSELGLIAARAALVDAGIAAGEVDLLIVATTTPDRPMPSTSAIIAGDLGVTGAAFDLNAACSGWVYGLVTGAAMMTAMGGRATLVVGAEVMSAMLDPADRATFPLFGDAAAAALLLPVDDEAPGDRAGAGGRTAGLLSWDLAVDGTTAGILQVPGGGTRLPLTPAGLAQGDQYLKMEGREVFRRAVRAVEASCCQTLERAGVEPSEVDLFVPHQANSRIVDAILPRLGIAPERTMMNIRRYGNTSAASIPLALCEAAIAGRLTEGDLVLVAGFGAGMTWATALMRWSYTGCGPTPPIILPAATASPASPA